MDADAVLRTWHHQSGEFSPDYYAYHGSNATSEFVRQSLDTHIEPDGAVLELGCSAGRHLAHLHEYGFEDLYGIDINDDAFESMEQAYPALAQAGTFAFDAIENVVPQFDDREFAAVYSVETLQHIHHENDWVFEHVARITDKVLVTVETSPDPGHRAAAGVEMKYINGEFPLYYRRWNDIFESYDFTEVESKPMGRNTARVFRRDVGDRSDG